jgi:hypothetical protein
MKVFDTEVIQFNAATSTLDCGPITHTDATTFTALSTNLPYNYGSGVKMSMGYTAPTSPGQYSLEPVSLQNAG